LSGKKEKKNGLPISMNIIEALAKFQQIELEDVEITFDELELRLTPGMVTGVPQAMPQAVPARARPTSLLEAGVDVPLEEYAGKIVEVTIGATKADGGTRGSTVTIGGEMAPAYYNFQSKTPHKPVIAFDVFDWSKVSLPRAVKMHYREVLEDTPEWARLCVDKFGGEMINLHFLSIDPLIEDTPAKDAVKKAEAVLEAVDVPIAIGGCGDAKKDLEVFTAIAEVTEGERILFNSVTLDMDIEATAKMLKKYGHTVIAFTPVPATAVACLTAMTVA